MPPAAAQPTIHVRTVAITPIIPRSGLGTYVSQCPALVELLIRERRALSRFIARYLDPASTEDTLQNLYLKASSVPGDPPILEPRGYLYRMAYHHALNRSKSDARERRAMAEYALDMAEASRDGEAQALDQRSCARSPIPSSRCRPRCVSASCSTATWA